MMSKNPNEFKQYMADNYLEHKVFDSLSDIIEYYRAVACGTFNFLPYGVNMIFNIDSYIFSSIEGTIDSIKLVLERGRINDAYALLRKYYDAIVMDIYKANYLKENSNTENWIVEKIDEWANGEGKLPWFEGMMKEIQDSENLKNLNGLFDFKGHYTKIRRKCNGHNHYHSLSIMMLNDNEIVNRNRIKELDQVNICVRDLFTLHFAYILELHPEYNSSSDYIDYLDSNMDPPENSQYWVAPVIQKTYDNFIRSPNKVLSQYFKESCCMKFDF